ncbi:MAG: BACON domain-containing protein, partial [Kiritimatiellae bacterium]|nr:BACON domain-containing protein [Kiritimatiellia bacterium]
SGTGGWKAHKDCSWITISPRTSGSCGESCIYTISANNTVTNRTGKITIDYLPQHPTNAQKFSGWPDRVNATMVRLNAS